jgi:hypothetical protein
MTTWLMLIYKVPPEPTRYRASVWRKLKAAGAVYLQNGVAVLPEGVASERVMRGIVQEVRDIDGTAHLIRGSAVVDEATLESAFSAARDEEYREVLGRCRDFHTELRNERANTKFTFAELEENEEDFAKLEAWLAKVVARDYFGAPLRLEAEEAIAACRDDLQTFALTVYDAVDHGSASTRHSEGALSPNPVEGVQD